MIKQLPLFFLISILISACSYTMKIQDGEMAIERKQYAVAVDMLKKEYKKADTRIEKGKIAYLLGTAYDGLNQGPDAISWYKTAYDNQYGVDALRNYAFALKQAEEYREAAIAFKELGLEIGSPYEYRKQIRACEVAAEWAEELRQEYEVEALAANSAASDYGPVLYGQEELIITSDRPSATGDDTYNWTGEAFSDFFVLNLTSSTVAPLALGFNTKDNEGTLSFSADQSKVFFTRCSGAKGEDAFCKILSSSQIADGTYGAAEALPFQEAGVNYMHPVLGPDGKTLYFSSDHPDGWGGFDIYSSTLNNGEWSEPKVLSRSVNTQQDEQFPSFDGDTLYFASSGHTGMGGLDVFRSYPLASGNWAPPFNLKPPVNSGGDDFSFVVDRRKSAQGDDVLATGYFTSRRGEIGGDDIYSFQQKILPPEPEPEVPENIVYKNTLDVYVVEKIYDDPSNPNSRVLGRKPLVGANLTIQLGREERSFEVDEEGKISLSLQDNSLYEFFAAKEGYLNNDAKFSSIGLPKDPRNPEQLYEVEIVMDKIFANREIVLENIYYDFDQSFIREDAKPTLNQLADILRKNPEVIIQLGSHTDCRGGDGYNEDLSQRRAQAAVDFLIESGIDAGRLDALGYGENEPSNDCLCNRCSEEEHQENRRTTFKIVQ
ncbi:MAG: OmpA family protein [Bacteroidota bacterium]